MHGEDAADGKGEDGGYGGADDIGGQYTCHVSCRIIN